MTRGSEETETRGLINRNGFLIKYPVFFEQEESWIAYCSWYGRVYFLWAVSLVQ